MPNPTDEPEVIETPAPAPEDIEEEDDLEPEVPGEAPPNETPEQKDARIAELTERNGKLYARIQRMKGKNANPAPANPAPAAPVAPAAPAETPGLTREEGILFARGFSEAEVEQAKKVATLQGVKLTDAVNDPLFTTWKGIEDKKAKDAKAQLPASRGGKPITKKTIGSPGLSDADHQELWKEKYGR